MKPAPGSAGESGVTARASRPPLSLRPATIASGKHRSPAVPISSLVFTWPSSAGRWYLPSLTSRLKTVIRLFGCLAGFSVGTASLLAQRAKRSHLPLPQCDAGEEIWLLPCDCQDVCFTLFSFVSCPLLRFCTSCCQHVFWMLPKNPADYDSFGSDRTCKFTSSVSQSQRLPVL